MYNNKKTEVDSRSVVMDFVVTAITVLVKENTKTPFVASTRKGHKNGPLRQQNNSTFIALLESKEIRQIEKKG